MIYDLSFSGVFLIFKQVSITYHKKEVDMEENSNWIWSENGQVKKINESRIFPQFENLPGKESKKARR